MFCQQDYGDRRLLVGEFVRLYMINNKAAKEAALPSENYR